MKRLVVVADDMGRFPQVNEAIAQAHERGIVTAASLMAGGEAFEEAAAFALARPTLSAGLHVTLCDGRAVLPHSRIPGLAGPSGLLEPGPARAGIRYWRRRKEVTGQIESEIAAQLDRLIEAGIRPAHVDGHHHLHMHPVIFPIVCRESARRGVRWIRIPAPSFSTGRLVEWAAFGALAPRHRRAAAEHGMMSAGRVHGLSRTGRIDETYLLDLLPRIGPGWNELFVHPDLATDAGRREVDALTSTRVREKMEKMGIVLSSFADIAQSPRPSAAGGHA